MATKSKPNLLNYVKNSNKIVKTIQIKARYNYTPIGMVKIQNTTHADENAQPTAAFIHCWKEC